MPPLAGLQAAQQVQSKASFLFVDCVGVQQVDLKITATYGVKINTGMVLLLLILMGGRLYTQVVRSEPVCRSDQLCRTQTHTHTAPTSCAKLALRPSSSETCTRCEHSICS